MTYSSARRVLLGLLSIWGAWTLYALFGASQSYLSRAYSQQPITFLPALRYSLLDSYTWAFLTPFVLWLGARFAIQKKTAWYAIPLHIVFAILFAVVYVQIFVRLLPLIGYRANARMTTTVMLARFHSDLLTYWVLIGLRHAVDYYRKYKDRELKATQLEARLAQAQLQVLKMQLQPHFLFNTLHAISALVHKDVEAADRMIIRLSEFLRLTLDSVGTQEIELKGELESLDKYLEIEQVRFGDRLKVHRFVDPETLDLLVPNLILQPLVENAVRHSIAPRVAGGRIEIRAHREDRTLVLEVEDDGAGAATTPLTEGVGLANTRARLEQLYGASQTMELLTDGGRGFRVRLTLPVHTAVDA
ncbi:MAG TPA: histidine kinase [Bryobacteraceae bacterium]|nr:histidine kinase [Bryobacteraceae bacterium]